MGCIQAEMSEDGGHSDDGDSSEEDDDQDGILVGQISPCQCCLHARLPQPPTHRIKFSNMWEPDPRITISTLLVYMHMT